MKSQTKTKKNYWASYNYPDNKVVGSQLMDGDREVIKNITGFSMSYIYDILSGKRHNDYVIECAREIISIRSRALVNLQKRNLQKAS